MREDRGREERRTQEWILAEGLNTGIRGHPGEREREQTRPEREGVLV